MATLSSDVIENKILSRNRMVHSPRRNSIDTKKQKQMKRDESLIAYSGTLFLKNRIKKKWKERFFVLYNDRRLMYWSNQYDFEHNNQAKACIDLSLTQNIEIVDNIDNGVLVKSPSDSLSRKGSMDFRRIFSHKIKKGNSYTHNNYSDEDESITNESMDHNGVADINRFIFKIIQTKKIYIFSIINDISLYKEWINIFELIIFGNILYKGYLFQLSKLNKKDKAKKKQKQKQKWMKRWFILYDRKELRYYNNATKKIPYGIVILSNLSSISKSEDYKAKKKYGQSLYLIKLCFEKTVIVLASLNINERNQWYHQITESIRIKHKKVETKTKTTSKKKKANDTMSLLKVPTVNNQSNRSKSATIATTNNIKQLKQLKQEIILPITPSISVSPSTTSTSIIRNVSNEYTDIYQTIQELQNEILYLKIQNAMYYNNNNNNNNNNNTNNKTIDDIDNELLDVDQYLILDKDWRNWTYLEIVEWITNLEFGRYNKYKITLFINMKHREMQGLYLPKIDKIDLSNFFGVANFADVCDLHKQIRRLIKT